MDANQVKACVIKLKRGFDIDGIYIGDRLDTNKGVPDSGIVACCESFRRAFSTGNRKITSFESPPGIERDGLNLTDRGGKTQLRLRLNSGTIDERVSTCPFCSASIELKVIRQVTLKNRYSWIKIGISEIDK